MTMTAIAGTACGRNGFHYDRTPRVESRQEGKEMAAVIVGHCKRLMAAGCVRRAAYELESAIENALTTDCGDRARWLQRFGKCVFDAYQHKRQDLGYTDGRTTAETGGRRCRTHFACAREL